MNLGVVTPVWKTILRLFRKESTTAPLTSNLIEKPEGLWLKYGDDLKFKPKKFITKCELYDHHNNLIYELEGGVKRGMGSTFVYKMNSKEHPSTHESIENHHLPGGEYTYIVWFRNSDDDEELSKFEQKFTHQNHPIPKTVLDEIIEILAHPKKYPGAPHKEILGILHKKFPKSKSSTTFS